MAGEIKLTQAQEQEVERQWNILRRGVVEIVPEDGLREKLAAAVAGDRPLKIKFGLDPTAPDIHVGHTVVIQKLRQFQELGHQIQFLIGDFTAKIGDPTGKSETRKPLTDEEIEVNARTYVKQYGKILDMSKTELMYNSTWLSKLKFEEVLGLAGQVTVARMLERDDFEKRYKANQAIGIHEFFYPLMQAYDSVAMECDIELGGTDQKFNLIMGRHIQREYGQQPQAIMTTPLLEGLDGEKKMSKSLGNYIGIDEAPNEIFGKTMSIPDPLMIKYFELATDLPTEELEKLQEGLQEGTVHPRDAKMRLASTLVTMYQGPAAAEQAEAHFKTVFQKGSLPDDIPEKEWTADVHTGLIDFIAELGLVPSKGEARRMIKQGAVKIDGQKLDDLQATVRVESGMVVQVGKRKFAKIK